MNRFQSSLSSSSRDSGELDYPAYYPSAPRDIDELTIPRSLLTDLMLRHLRMQGVSPLRSLSALMKLSSPVLHSLFEQLRTQQLIEVKGST